MHVAVRRKYPVPAQLGRAGQPWHHQLRRLWHASIVESLTCRGATPPEVTIAAHAWQIQGQSRTFSGRPMPSASSKIVHSFTGVPKNNPPPAHPIWAQDQARDSHFKTSPSAVGRVFLGQSRRLRPYKTGPGSNLAPTEKAKDESDAVSSGCCPPEHGEAVRPADGTGGMG